jgi:hypothetical protein
LLPPSAESFECFDALPSVPFAAVRLLMYESLPPPAAILKMLRDPIAATKFVK